MTPARRERAIWVGSRAVHAQIAALTAMTTRLDAIADAVALILMSQRVATCGIGKSGLVARRIAATLASTGQPAYFVHAADALHGDLGMIGGGDIILVVSQSGETPEILELLPRLLVPIVAITGSAASPLARAARVRLDTSIGKEGCPLNLAPMASAAAGAAMGDALAAALMDARGFAAHDFAHTHPAGELGRRLSEAAA